MLNKADFIIQYPFMLLSTILCNIFLKNKDSFLSILFLYHDLYKFEFLDFTLAVYWHVSKTSFKFLSTM